MKESASTRASDIAWEYALKKDYENAYFWAQRAVKEKDFDGVFLYALILENGWLDSHKDLEGAYKAYRKLAVEGDSTEGYLGCARIMIEMQRYEYRDEAIEFCEYSKIGMSKRVAYLLEGRIYEELHRPPDYKNAKRMYFKSACHGSHWAWRRYAKVLLLSGKKVRARLVILLYFIVWPFYRCIIGKSCRRAG